MFNEFKKYFTPLENAPCPKTEQLIKSGVQQSGDGYIAYAKSLGMTVDYTQALPKQGWHFVKSYLERSDPQTSRIDKIQCTELVYWLAEVSHALSDQELDELAEKIKSIPTRREANYYTRAYCFPRICDIVLGSEKTEVYDPTH